MKKAVLFLLLLGSSIFLNAQQVSNVDFDAIRNKLDASPSLYKDLLARFEKADTTLTEEDHSILYYGQCFQKDYNPYGKDSENFDKFMAHYKAEEFEKALPYALKMIKKNPLDMSMTLRALICYYRTADENGKSIMGRRYKGIMNSIFKSGDGRTDATAFVVMCVSDEYELMGNLQVQNSSQSLIGSCDVMTLKKNDLGLEKLYFNVSKPMQSMMKMMKGN